ncbi:MAG: hypothetical protein V3V08_26070 [Nannocystaceae bacterium]
MSAGSSSRTRAFASGAASSLKNSETAFRYIREAVEADVIVAADENVAMMQMKYVPWWVVARTAARTAH